MRRTSKMDLLLVIFCVAPAKSACGWFVDKTRTSLGKNSVVFPTLPFWTLFVPSLWVTRRSFSQVFLSVFPSYFAQYTSVFGYLSTLSTPPITKTMYNYLIIKEANA